MSPQPQDAGLAHRNVLLVGYGFVGWRVLRILIQEHAFPWVITREEESAMRAAQLGAPASAVDIADREALQLGLQEVGHIHAVIHCASSSRGGPEAYRRVFLEGARNLLELLPDARLVLSSSTSVYGQTDGEVVDETAPAESKSETSQILCEAERLVLSRGGIVARLAGLYGPGRWVQLNRLREGTAVLEDGGERWQNQVHRDDAASALAFLAAHGRSASIYNVTDDLPMTQKELYSTLCARTGLPLPPAGAADPNRKRGVTSKRVSNARLDELGWRPRYPTVAAALRDDAQLLKESLE